MTEGEKTITGAFTLTMLGTDTLYFPKLKQKREPGEKKSTKVEDYPKGETLSVISTAINTQDNPLINPKSSSPYQADEVTVVNGPETTGSNVNDRIAHGLAAALKAIARGQKPINIISHSRGAVESILIAHELDAIQQMIKENPAITLDELLAKMDRNQSKRSSNTKDIIKTLKEQLPKKDVEAWFQNLKENIPATSINFFGIDPVPGDIFPITWYDERFYTLPGIIKNAEIIYYENERSDWGFTPIYPEASNSSQKIVHQFMPGHHGTGSSGNNRSQQYVEVNPGFGKTTHVQKLLMYKIIGFLTSHGVRFKTNPDVLQKGRGLGKKYANDPAEVSNIEDIDFPVVYRKLYQKISENKDAYAQFNKTHYKIMGLSAQRKILRTSHKYGVLNNVLPKTQGYVNEEHASLMKDYFFKIFKLDSPDTLSLAELITQAHNELDKNIRDMPGTVNPKSEQELASSYMSDFEDISPNTPLLASEATRKDVLANFSALISHVSQKYLTDDWDTEEKQQEKNKFFTAVTETMNNFKALLKTNNKETVDFVNQLINLGLSGITHTVEQIGQDLEQNFKRLHMSADEDLNHFFNNLVAQLNHAEHAPQIEKEINDILASEEFMALDDAPIKIKITFLWKNLKRKLPDDVSEEDFITQLNAVFEKESADIPLNERLHLFFNGLVAQIDNAENAPIVAKQISDIVKNKDFAALENHPILAKISFIWLKLGRTQPKELSEHDFISHLAARFEDEFEDDLEDFEHLYHQLQIFIKDLVALNNLAPDQKAVFNQYELSLRQKAETLIDDAAQRFYRDRPQALPEPAEKGSVREIIERHAINVYKVRDRAAEENALLKERNEQLATNLSEVQKQTQSLKKALEERQQQNQMLTGTLAEQQQQNQMLTDELTEQQKQNQVLAGELAEQREQKQAVTGELTKQQKQNQVLAGELAELREQKQAVTDELTEQQKQNQVLAGELAEQREQKQAVTDELTEQQKQNQVLADALAEQQRLNQALTDELQQEKQEAEDAYQEAMNTEKEAEYLLLITKKLLPLTQDYLTILQASTKKDDKKDQKIGLVNNLLDCLQDTKKIPQPSERVRAFFRMLNENEKENELKLKEHRDPRWSRYVRNCVIVLGILGTGILPGLIALAIYVNTGIKSGKSSLFWHSAGENIVDGLNKHKKDADLPSDNIEEPDDKDDEEYNQTSL